MIIFRLRFCSFYNWMQYKPSDSPLLWVLMKDWNLKWDILSPEFHLQTSQAQFKSDYKIISFS